MKNRGLVSKSESTKKFKVKVSDNPLNRDEPQQLRTYTDDVSWTDDETFAI